MIGWFRRRFVRRCEATFRFSDSVVRCEHKRGHKGPTAGGVGLMHFADCGDGNAIAWPDGASG